MNWTDWASTELAAIQRSNRWREPIVFDGVGPAGVVNGRPMVSFASNDYLGLAGHPRVCRAAQAAIERFGAGATSARLIAGTRYLHKELEHEIAAWKNTERAVVFPSGFAANLGALSVFGTAEVTILSDALNHASIIDGCRLARAEALIYRHGDVEHLEQLLRAAPGKKLVVTDLIFSMDGDCAPLREIAALCVKHDALLVLDEAHDALNVKPDLPEGLQWLRVGTLSKMLGAAGGWAAGPQPLIELLINRARSFIYTTALSPADTAAALEALRIIRSPEGEALRSRLRTHIDRIRPAHPSAIVPVVFGGESAALAAAAALYEQGIYIPAIRPPTVPAGTSRLRIAVSAAHTDAMVDQLIAVLSKLPSN